MSDTPFSHPVRRSNIPEGFDKLRVLRAAVVPLGVRVSDECALFIMHVDLERDYAPLTVERTLIDAVRVQHPDARDKQPSIPIMRNIVASLPVRAAYQCMESTLHDVASDVARLASNNGEAVRAAWASDF